MKKRISIFLSALITLSSISAKADAPGKNKKIYHKHWIDLNKNGEKDIYEDPEANIDDRIEDLLSQMTMDEKTAQMVTLYGYKRVLNDSLPTPEWKKKLWKDGIGAIDEHLNGFQGWGRPPMATPHTWPASEHAWAINEVQRFFIEETRLGIPADFTNEGIRGIESFKATNFPTQLALGHTWDKNLINKIGYITGREARLLGYTNVYAPILDVGRDQRWGRMEEVYGESPFLVAELGVAMTKGLQKDNQVAATAKHFAIYSNNKGAREGLSRVDPQISPRETEYIHLYPFGRVIREAGLLGIMSSYNDYDGIPVQSSYYYLTEVLRNRFGFKGYIVSDSDAVIYLYNKHRTAGTYKEAVRQSVEAGLNVRCTFRSPESYVDPLRELIEEGALSEETINDRVRDILRVKFKIGLFDSPYVEDNKLADEVVNSEENQKIALEASRKSIVLLKNQEQMLPLDKNTINKIAVIGPNADNGDYALTHYGPLAVEVSTVLDGIKQKAGKEIEVVYEKGAELVDSNWPDSEIMPSEPTEEEQSQIERAVKAAAGSDVSVVVVGGSQRTCGENKSRTSLDLPGHQLKLLKAVQATGKPVIAVVISGRPLSINWTAQNVSAIIQAFYPGSKGGEAIADVIFGDYNPGGKLTVTIPKTVGQIPFNFPYKPGSQVNAWGQAGPEGSRARVNGALFPFGFGLSYTTFEYSNLKVTPKSIKPGDDVKISVSVKNTGSQKGDEVVQLYLQDKISTITTYDKMLRGFERVSLEPGQQKTINFTIKGRDMALLNKDMEWEVEPGTFLVMAGASSEDIKLKEEFEVISEDASALNKQGNHRNTYIHASSNQQNVRNLTDVSSNTRWESKSNEATIDFELSKDAKPSEIRINWGKRIKAQYNIEIQLSGGGGQFIPVFNGKNKLSEGMESYQFEGFPATDLRLIIHTVKNEKITISDIRLDQLKTE